MPPRPRPASSAGAGARCDDRGAQGALAGRAGRVSRLTPDDASPEACLGAQGLLSHRVPGFAPREQQVVMASAVARALAEGTTLAVEAGTGTGKTYAYLVPALLSGLRVIISTGTRNLQDQLFHRDLPVVRGALGSSSRVALLKGRANYLCRYRLDRAEERGHWRDREEADAFARVRTWAASTRTGDIAEVSDLPEDASLWSRVTSTAESCLGSECPRFEECCVLAARRRAQEADVLVINHHLLFADMALKDEGFGEILPGADAFIVDEAHQLPEVAGHFFGVSLSARALVDLGRDSLAEQRREAADFPVLGERAGALAQAVADMTTALGAPRRAPWSSVADTGAVAAATAGLGRALGALAEALAEAASRSKGLESCRHRAQDLSGRLDALVGGGEGDHVHWFECHPRGFSLHATPLDVAPAVGGHLQAHQGAWVFTSATLAVGDDFGHFSTRLGLERPATLRLDSPFDFRRNALLYHPRGLPEPTAPGYTAAVVEAARPVIEASGGRAFLLFTSYRALREAAGCLEGRLGYPLLIQGTRPKAVLLERFQGLGNAVLLGTASFWEGVDVRGEALSCVVIDRLPFASPAEPVLQARAGALRRAGSDPFLDYQLPQAVIALKQGAGRLIRDVGDRGVLMLCDPRLLTRPYGRVFLESLPPMGRTRALERVRSFLADDEGRDG